MVSAGKLMKMFKVGSRNLSIFGNLRTQSHLRSS